MHTLYINILIFSFLLPFFSICKSSSPLPLECNNSSNNNNYNNNNNSNTNSNTNLFSSSPSATTTPTTNNNNNNNNNTSSNKIYKPYSPLPSTTGNINPNILLANSSYITPSRFELKAKELSRRQKWIQAASRRCQI